MSGRRWRTRSVADRRSTSPARQVRRILALLGWALVVLLPIYWLVVTSFKTPYQVDKGPFYIPFVDFQPTLDAWHYILFDLGNDTLRPYINTVIVGLSSSIIALILGSLAAYALVRFTYRPRFGIIGLFIASHGVRVRRDGARGAVVHRVRLRARRSSSSSPRPSGGGSSGRSATATSRSG